MFKDIEAFLKVSIELLKDSVDFRQVFQTKIIKNFKNLNKYTKIEFVILQRDSSIIGFI